MTRQLSVVIGFLLTFVGAASAQSTSPDPHPATPGPRSSHVMTWDPASETVVLMGGLDRPDGLWSWAGGTWVRLGDAGDPASRAHTAAAHVPGTGELIIQGGFEGRRGQSAGWDARYGDTWLRAPGADWRRVAGSDDGPGVRDHHAMVADPARGEVILFGGGRGPGGDDELLGDTWVWKDGAWRLAATAADGPPARATHRLVYDTRRERVVLFAGFGDAGLLNDVWEWDGESWMEVTPADGSAPSPRFAARLAYDEARGLTVLFAGREQGGDLADTWTWDGEAWQQVAAGGPPPRNVHGMAYDRAREVIVLYGGIHSQITYDDTWEWDGGGWTQVEAPRNEAR